MRRVSWLVWCVCLVAVSAATAWAQGTTSRVTGVVTDSTGGAVPGATVTLTNEGTGLTFTTVTTDAGAYTFEAVQVGQYTVKVELQGFKSYESTGNVVRIGEPKTVNAVLETGAVAEIVQVVGGAETVQLSTSGNYGSVLDQKAVESLPIVGTRGRNPLSLVTTQPGVVSGANTGGGVHVHGARDRSWNFTLDGIDVNETSAGGSNFAPLRTNPDSLAEFKVLTGNTTAEFGRNSGGQVAMVSRSGTNEFHGTGFYFGRRPEFNANEWQFNIDHLPKREFIQDIYGFSLGGPIRRNKAFFYTNLQILRAEQSGTFTRNVYTQSARNGIWRYVVGGRNTPAGATGASVDADGNVLSGVNIATYNLAANDPSRLGLNTEMQRVLALTPLPNTYTVGDGLNLAGYTFAAIENEEQYDFSAKVDYAFSPKHYTFVRYSKGEQNTLCDQVNGGDPAFPGLPCRVDTFRDPWNVAASWRWNPGSNIVNELVVGANHFTFDFVTPTADPSRYILSATGFPSGLVPTLPEAFDVGNLRTLNTFQIVNNTSYMRGAHSFKAGTNIRLQQHKDIRGSVSGVNVTPTVNFSTGTTSVDPTAFNLPSNIQQANDRPLLESSINLLLGRVGTISQGFVSTGDTYAPGGTTFVFDSRFPELDFYVQDSWKPRPNLTVDLGLRWELKLSPRNPQDLLRRPNQRVAVDEAPSATLNWVQEPLYDDDMNNLAPSAGFAWDPTGSGKQVVRANYRLAYDRINTFVISSAVLQSIPGITTGVTNSTYGPGGGRLVSSLPSLQPTFTPVDALQPGISANTMRVMDSEFQSPMTHGWSIGYQRELWKNNVLEVAYFGRKGENLIGAYDVNQAEIFGNGFLDAFNIVKAGGESALMNQLLGADSRRLPTETGSQFARRQFATQLATNSVGNMAGQLGSRLQGGRLLTELAGLGPYFFYPYPQFLGGGGGGALIVIDSEDWSRYHALEVKLERRFRGGLGWLLGYTLAKSQDTRSFDPAFTVANTGSAQSASSTPFNIHDRSLNYAPSDFDRRHVVQASFVTELPFGNGKWFGGDAQGVLDRIIGGWELAGFMTVQSGRPMTAYSGANTLSNVVQTPANCNGCDGSEGSVHDEDGLVWYFTPEERAQFGFPAPGEFSNVGRNAFRGDGGFNLDLALVKRTRIVGSQVFEFRLDATNLTNTPTFDFPTLVSNNALFGRIRNSVVSASRKVQIGLKYSF
jgi:Carboxypeptidase regulatory-like domain/TonB-dependent Receptor Plug Domain